MSLFKRSFITALLLAHGICCFVPTNNIIGRPRPISLVSQCGRGLLCTYSIKVKQSRQNHSIIHHKSSERKRQLWWPRWNMVENPRQHFFVIGALLVCAFCLPSPCSASGIISSIPSPNDMKEALVSILDGLSHSGIKGMLAYTSLYILWTMTVGVTTPVETAAGMAFPLQTSIILSAIGKIGGAFFQYTLAKYLFSDYAQRKMKNNEWMSKIDSSFEHHPFGVALIWRFSPLPEFVKNIGPALVPTLRTRYQLLAILTHGLPFTILWSIMGSEAARVAHGGKPSLLLKRMVFGITWIGLFVSPTLFGMWIKGLGGGEPTEREM